MAQHDPFLPTNLPAPSAPGRSSRRRSGPSGSRREGSAAMKVLLALAGLTGVAAVAVIVLVLREPRSAQRGESVADASGAALADVARSVEALAAEVRALRERQERLDLRVADVEARPDPAPAPAREVVPAGPPPEKVEQALEMVAAIQDPSKGSAPGLESFVLDVLQEKEQRERTEREERRRTAVQDALQERVAELATELGLSPYQSQELSGILSGEATRRDALFAELRDTGVWDRRTMRDSMIKLREETDGALQTVLTPEQLARYRELEERPPFFGGGGRGPRGPGDPAGG